MNVGYKMVFAVNSALKMGLGKTAAQVGHATLGLYRTVQEQGDSGLASLSVWDEDGEPKVVVKAESDTHLLDLQRKAQLDGILCYLVRDAGRTQIPTGSVTVLSLFGPTTSIDQLTGQLKLV